MTFLIIYYVEIKESFRSLFLFSTKLNKELSNGIGILGSIGEERSLFINFLYTVVCLTLHRKYIPSLNFSNQWKCDAKNSSS